jgi:hypothetical protein
MPAWRHDTRSVAMRTTSSLHRSVLRAGLVALVLLVVGFAGALPAVANPGIDDPGFAPGGDGPPPPDPPPPGPQDEGIPDPPPDDPPPPPPPPPPADDGAGGGGVDPLPVPEVEPVAEDSVVPADGTPGKEADRASTELAAGTDLAAEADSSPSAFKTGLGLLLAVLATVAGLLFVLVRRRRREEEAVPTI